MELTNPINVRFTPNQRARLEAISLERGSALPEIVRRAVDFWLEHNQTFVDALPPASERPPPSDLHEVPFIANPAPSRFSRGVKVRRR